MKEVETTPEVKVSIQVFNVGACIADLRKQGLTAKQGKFGDEVGVVITLGSDRRKLYKWMVKNGFPYDTINEYYPAITAL